MKKQYLPFHLLHLLCFIFSFTSCAWMHFGRPKQIHGLLVYEADYNESIRVLSTRTSFETRCPKKQLRFRPLVTNTQGRESLAPHYVTQIGVEACGKKLVYMRSFSQPWHLNSVSSSGDLFLVKTKKRK